jgi:hypothetical protein
MCKKGYSILSQLPVEPKGDKSALRKRISSHRHADLCTSQSLTCEQ